MFKVASILALASIATALTLPESYTNGSIPHGYTERDLDGWRFAPRAASCSFPNPSSANTVKFTSPTYIASGQTYDGGNKRYDRGTGACESGEGGEADTVFVLENGATLQNAVIGRNQQEGVYCKGSCTIRNVWFEDVCEDAISAKGDGTVKILGGGAKSASDKVVQHNGGGTVIIDSYCVQTAGKLYRSCGNCSTQKARKVIIANSIASSVSSTLAGVNSNYGDVATVYINTIQSSSVSSRCDTYQGNNSGAEPKKLTTNTANSNCVFNTGSYTP